MEKTNNFKEFVKKNPKLLKYVKNGEMTWQRFYEMYDIYGETNDVWNEYIPTSIDEPPAIQNATSQTTANFGLTDLVSWLKNVDLDSIQNSVSSVQRVLGVVQELTSKTPDQPKDEYKPRPIYKHFED